MPDIEIQRGICCITGEKTDCIAREELIGKSFNNHDYLLAPESNLISLEAWRTLKYKWERASSFFCDGKNFLRLSRVGVRDKFFEPEMPDMWIGYATTSYKKHGCFAVKMNMSRKSRIWSFEMRRVDASDIAKRDDWWGRLNEYLRLGISRPVMETLSVNPAYIPKIGVENWLKFEAWARNKYQSNLYAFLCYLLPSQEELKEERKDVVDIPETVEIPEKKENINNKQLELF
jgi:hypothetical protein